MGTIMPQGELIRRSVKWIDKQRLETGKSVAELVDAAAMQFNLSPKDAHFLAAFFQGQRENDQH